MAGSLQQTVIIAKLEVTAGTDAAPSAATAVDAVLIRVSGLAAKIDQKMASRDIVRGFFGAPDLLPYTRRGAITFSVELASCAAVGTNAPGWGKLLQGCGYTETLTAAGTPRADYTPTLAAVKSLTIWAYINGKLEKFTYCAGSFKLNLKVGQVPTLDFQFQGLCTAAPTQVAAPATTLSLWQRPLAVGAASASALSIGASYVPGTGVYTVGTAYNFQEFSVDAGNDVQDLELASAESVSIYGRSPSAHMVADLGAAAIVTQYANLGAGTAVALGVQHGSAANARVYVFAPKAVLTAIDDSISGNVMLNTMDFSLTPSAATGGDELVISAQ